MKGSQATKVQVQTVAFVVLGVALGAYVAVLGSPDPSYINDFRARARMAEHALSVAQKAWEAENSKLMALKQQRLLQQGCAQCPFCQFVKGMNMNRMASREFFYAAEHQKREILQSSSCSFPVERPESYPGVLKLKAPSQRWTDNLPCTEYKVHSQNGEDGVISALLAVIGYYSPLGKHEFVEFVTEDGSVTNTRFLRAAEEWKGLLMDGSYDDPGNNLHKEMIHQENIVSLLHKYNVPQKLDLLSIDTDCYDLWIARSIFEAGYKPRLVVVGVNSKWPTNVSLAIPPAKLVDPLLAPESRCPMTEWHGASPAAYSIFAECYGYTMVYCERQGFNCFLIRNEFLPDGFEQQPAAQLWRTPRYGDSPGGGWPRDQKRRPFLHIRSCEDIRSPDTAPVVTPEAAHKMAEWSAPSLPSEPKAMTYKQFGPS